MSSPSSAQDLLNPDLIRKFSDRIVASLKERPIKLDAKEHRRQLADLLARVGELNNYQLLELTEDATGDEVYDAYVEIARLVHPSHVPRLQLEGLAAGPELLFERATLAYMTLSDETRRLAYHVEIGLASATSGPVPVGEQRKEEERKVAERNYQMARRLAEEHEYFNAIEVLRSTVRMVPKGEYYRLLARCENENPKWRRKAIQSYIKAIELNPADDESRLELAELYEHEGNVPMARREYLALLERVPGHPDAVDALKRLKE